MGKRKGELLEQTLEPLQFIPIKVVGIEVQKYFVAFADYILYLKNCNNLQNEKLIPVFFQQIIDSMVYELYFTNLLKKHDREIIKHLGELPEITENMNDAEKMKICKDVFNRLDDKSHPVRNNLFYMNSIPEIRIIEGNDENN